MGSQARRLVLGGGYGHRPGCRCPFCGSTAAPEAAGVELLPVDDPELTGRQMIARTAKNFATARAAEESARAALESGRKAFWRITRNRRLAAEHEKAKAAVRTAKAKAQMMRELHGNETRDRW